MAFPTIAATASSVQATNSTSHSVSLPTGISAGDLLIVLIAVDGSANSNISIPSGWSQGYTDELNSGGVDFAIRYKIADGTEGSSLSLTTSDSETSSHHALRITGHDATTPLEAARVEGSSTTPDPPSLTPSWGAKDTLWIACYGADNDGLATAYPTNYSGSQFTQRSGAGAGHCELGMATRNLNATSDNPGTFTIDVSGAHIAVTLAIQPAAAGSSETPPPGGAVAGGTGPAPASASQSGGATAAGQTPAPSVPSQTGGALAAGIGPGIRASVSAGGASAGGFAPTDGTAVTETPVPGGASTGGVGPLAAVSTTAGGAASAGLSPAAYSTVTTGGATGTGASPLPAISTTAGGVAAAGNAPLVYVLVTSGGVTVGGPDVTDPLAIAITAHFGPPSPSGGGGLGSPAGDHFGPPSPSQELV